MIKEMVSVVAKVQGVSEPDACEKLRKAGILEVVGRGGIYQISFRMARNIERYVMVFGDGEVKGLSTALIMTVRQYYNEERGEHTTLKESAEKLVRLGLLDGYGGSFRLSKVMLEALTKGGSKREGIDDYSRDGYDGLEL